MLLSTLTDIDFAHEHEVERVRASTTPPSLKASLIRKLAQNHHDRRAPYLHQITRLQSREPGFASR